ncbi:MAG TPA: hypothetical protein VL475_08715 [Planctomycetaceae bacterium]|jgi:hypothetical protein|nr:hypothetical protein [Planctomycetaceae bacterium]
MNGSGNSRSTHRPTSPVGNRVRGAGRDLRPVAAFRQRGHASGLKLEDFSAPENWHEARESGEVRYVVQPAGEGFIHAVTPAEIRDRLADLPARFTRQLAVVQFSAMTRKRRLFPCYGMQWGWAVYLHPIEATLVEAYHRPPTPQQRIEARMFGGRWSHDGTLWRLTWTERTIKDFYLNNVLIHEIGHLNDPRNSSTRDRERFANWFAIEYGYRATRGRTFTAGAARRSHR